MTTTRRKIQGGIFLIEELAPEEMFTPEDFTDEHLNILRTAEEFMEREVLPHVEEIEHQKEGLMPALVRKAAELGLVALEIPEKYGGLELDKICSTVVAEQIGRMPSYAVSHGGHTGIGTAPIAYFGTEDQKARYLPRLATGERLAAYALTEASSGSDALAAKTKATLSADGKHYALHGEKMWITNAAFADVFIVFAKVDGEKFTAFIVEKDFPGFGMGAEEKKMGIKGSSTRALHLDGCRVPAENVLGEVGHGHKIAFNILNFGRFNLGAYCMGGSKMAIQDAIRYAKQRQQFGQPICEFGAIQHKIAEMVIRAYAGESMVYRTAGHVDERLRGVARDNTDEILKAMEEFAIECSIIKVYGSEMSGYVVDEAVQIYGGYGYSQDYPVERYYRDARINRIFEGTNEINRLLIPGMLLKRAMKGQLPLLQATQRVFDELLSFPGEEQAGHGPLAEERGLLRAAKKAVLLTAGAASQRYRDQLADQQEILLYLADMVMDAYAAESALVRAWKLHESRGEKEAELQTAAVRVFLQDALDRMERAGKQVLAACASGDSLRTQLAALRRFLSSRRDPQTGLSGKLTPVDSIGLRRQIARAAIQAERYFF